MKKYFILGFIAIMFTCPTTSLQASIINDFNADTIDDIKGCIINTIDEDIVDNIKNSINDNFDDDTIDNIKDSINDNFDDDTINDIKDIIVGAFDDDTIDDIKDIITNAFEDINDIIINAFEDIKDVIVDAFDDDTINDIKDIIINALDHEVNFYTSFEDYKSGTAYTRDLWEEDGFNPNNWDNGLEERAKISSKRYSTGSKSLEIEYDEDEYGSQDTGAQVELMLPPRDEYYASYKVKFEDGFSWGSDKKGGKLPGLTGGDKCGDDFVCDGTDGFSARYMWRDEGYPELYLYAADMESGQYGDDIPFQVDGTDFQFETGKWYTITEHVKLNSDSDSDDGVVETWVNGEKVIDLDDITFVTNDQKIDTFYFSTFFGGHDKDWAPSNTSYSYFDDLKISTNKNNVDFE